MKTIPLFQPARIWRRFRTSPVLITDFIHPEMIVLSVCRYAFVRYPGGYELLILTANQLAVGVKEVDSIFAMNFLRKTGKSLLSFTSFVDRCFRSPPFFPKPFLYTHSQGGSFTSYKTSLVS